MHRLNQIDSTSPMGLMHPVGGDVRLRLNDVAVMIRRSLNCVDARLIDHGLRVATVLNAMLDLSGLCTPQQRRALYLVALLHDIGAYRTEDIDRLVEFETNDVWEHSFYGYLFFKELSPLHAYAEVILYHHMPNELFTDQDNLVRFLAQSLYVADRVDVLLIDDPDLDAEGVAAALTVLSPDVFDPDTITLFVEANRRHNLIDGLKNGFEEKNPLQAENIPSELEKAVSCLDMLVHVIDFRSRHTVTHTVTTARVAYELALRMLGDRDAAGRVYFSALLHDLGKIGIPLSILEKPGRLDADEMDIMRTHVTLSEDIISGCVGEDVVRMAARHHEKLDGSGYPRGLHAEELTLPERIIVVADIVSALVGTRSYKEAYPKEKVLSLLTAQGVDGLVDTTVVDEVARSFDDILQEVEKASLPVSEAYDRVQTGYAWLLGELEKKRQGSDDSQ